MRKFVVKVSHTGLNDEMSHIETTIAVLRAKYPDDIQELESFRGEFTIVVEATALFDICKLLRHDPDLDYSFLVDLAAVDYYPRQPRFGVSYLLHAIKQNVRLRLKVLISGQSPTLPSVTDIWSSAEWPEREAFDLMGIEFTGHPDLRRILMPADWEGHPLRKDHALGYEEVQFSFNWREIDRRKEYPQE